jgi:opacity protein-like surface antigen
VTLRLGSCAAFGVFAPLKKQTSRKIMKKITLTFLMLISATVLFAQMGFGLKAGANLSKMKSKFDDGSLNLSVTSDSRLSFNAGVFFIIPFSEKVGLQPELVLSSEGGKSESDGSKEVAKYTFVNLPVLLRFTVVNNFNLYVGPQIGFNVGAKYESELRGAKEKGDVEDVSGLGLGVGMGAGYYLTEKLEVNARYNLGLSNWYDGEGSENISNKITTIQVGLAFKIK